jgi:uncharacterized LabA/DUF88 family protein
LIIGTKYFKLNTEVLYWILFVGIATSTNLSNTGGLKRITQFMKMIPQERYMDLFKISKDFQFPSFITNPDSSVQMSKFISNTHSNLEKTVGLFDNVLNKKNWNEEVGFGSHTSISVTTALQQTQGTQEQVIHKTRSLVSTYIANEITRLVQNASYTVIGSTDVDLTDYISKLSENLIETVDNNTRTIVKMLTSSFERTENISQGESLMDKFKGHCQNIGNIGPLKILTNINQASFKLRDNDPLTFLDFVQDLSEPTAKLAALSRELERVIDNVGNLSSDSYGNPVELLRNGRDGLKDIIRDLFIGFFGYDKGILRKLFI